MENIFYLKYINDASLVLKSEKSYSIVHRVIILVEKQ